MLTYSEYDFDAWASDNELSNELNNDFVYINDLIKLKSLNEFLKSCSRSFLELIEESKFIIRLQLRIQ